MVKLAAAIAVACIFGLLRTSNVLAWGYQGHRVVGSIADRLLNDNARSQVEKILNDGAPPDGAHNIDLRLAGPWADCVKSVQRHSDGSFEYVVNQDHLEWEVPCTLFKSVAERARMVDYAARNWSNCLYQPNGPDKPADGCHNTYHFDDVAIERDHFDRSYQGTNEHDLVAAIGAAIAVLSDKPAPPPFSIKDKKEALLMLAHFVGDLQQPLHVGSVYLDADGKLIDPDIAHAIDPVTATAGGNLVQDQNVNLHGEWDDIPTDLGDAATRELLAVARAVPPSHGAIEEWPANWATDTMLVSHRAFEGLQFQHSMPLSKVQWTVAFDDHIAYLWLADQIKRRQLAKGGARLAEILNAIWP
jgi:S1/P1 Nuclease